MNPADPSAKGSGLVIPQPLSWDRRLAASTVYGLIRIASSTMRYRWSYHPDVLKGEKPKIFCIWHNRLALSLLMHEHYACTIGETRKLAAIVSASRDGGVVARILEHFKVQPVRGSSSRRGPQALLELTTWAERGYDIAITPDGPRGPRYVVQPGVIALGQITGLPIVPSGCRLHWKYRLNSWDQFQVPIPFSRAEMSFAEPLHVPRDASETQREKLREELQRRLVVANGT